MNLRFKLNLINYFNRPKNKGFALMLGMMVGLVMVLAGITMIVRSQSDQTQVTAQKNKAKSVSVAEMAVTRYLNFINENRAIAMFPSCDDNNSQPNNTNCGDNSWYKASSNTILKNELKSCENPNVDSQATEVKNWADKAYQWQDIDSNNPSKGQFRFIGYTYNGTVGEAPGMGQLTIEGRVNGGDKATESPSRIVVNVPVQQEDLPTNLPGLWLKGNDANGTGGNEIAGDVFVSDCRVSLSNINVASGYSAYYTQLEFPSLPYGDSYSNVPTSIPEISLGSSTASKDIVDTPTSTVAHFNFIESFTTRVQKFIFGEPAFAKKKDKDDNSGGGGNTTTTFPRAGDSPTKTETYGNQTINIYEYRISGNITDDVTIKTVDGSGNRQKVIFYLAGDIDPHGNNKIKHSCKDDSGIDIVNCKVTDFQIFGYSSNGKICLHGSHQTEGFILAPNYTAGVKGGGGGKGGLKGSIWLDTWGEACASSTSNVVVEQTGTWKELGEALTPDNLPPTISNVSSWGQKAVPAPTPSSSPSPSPSPTSPPDLDSPVEDIIDDVEDLIDDDD